MVGQRLYRKPDEIASRINSIIQNYIDSYKQDLTSDEKAIIDKIKKWDIKVERQIMEIFQSSITDEEFDELLEISLHTVVDLMTQQAKEDGIITQHEERIISYMSNVILKNTTGA